MRARIAACVCLAPGVETFVAPSLARGAVAVTVSMRAMRALPRVLHADAANISGVVGVTGHTGTRPSLVG